ncbi:lytic murein transglycosylase, partial [uncultured Jatrophihabitans sp.]|uniref:lytic transglycosylase domain-containing protein n=1 Tax=uncultured Jatrophihabitans sp. TaxID=1610747 RepID=UPI0035CA4AEB
MPHDHSSRAARVRLAQCVGAATAVAVCSLVAALSAGMSAGADTEAVATAHGSARHHVLAAGALGAATSAPARTPRPAAPTKATTPVDTTAVSTLAASGIPHAALNAYRVAAARLGHAQPSCGIPWYLLAGIGRVESDHGQFGGAVLHRDGLSTPRTVGPSLNGKGNQFIPAPPNGLALDGDAKYAHALGPMQFIPSTWADWGADANGDGTADIFNINDAALAAARYLCAAGGDLRSTAGRSAAVLSYNHLTSYRDEVLALADAYRRGITPTGPMIGNTTGSLPATGHT